MAMNHAAIQGRLTKEPDLRYTQNQTPVASFTVAVDRDYAPKGEKKKVDFIDCVAWRSKAEFVTKYFHKGTAAVVSGRMEINPYTDKNGSKHFPMQINVGDIYFGESKKASHSASGSPTMASDDEDVNPFTGEPAPYGDTIQDFTEATGISEEDQLPY